MDKRPHPIASVDADARRDALQLVVAYHASARAEVIQRVGHRDSTALVFLAAAAVVTGSVLREGRVTDDSALVLMMIPVLGLGASFARAQHNGVIGALGEYLATELSRATTDLLRAPTRETPQQASVDRGLVPVDWDSSNVMHESERRRNRALSGIVLLVVPQFLAAIAVAAERECDTLGVAGAGAGVACALWSGYIVWTDEARREKRFRNIARCRAKRESPATDAG